MNMGLGRKPSPPDDRDFALRGYLKEVVPAERFWLVGEEVLDQGSTPHCVGFGWAGWGNCEPVDDDYQNDDGHTAGESGSYVRSGAKAMKNRGRLGAYAFGSLEDARRFVLTSGPVTLGIDWYDGMFDPDNAGRIRPTGAYAGGHCVMLYGADEEYAYIQNSWGWSWGLLGGCKMTWSDLLFAFGRYGEACAAVELPLEPTPPDPPAPTSWWVRLWRFIRALFYGEGW